MGVANGVRVELFGTLRLLVADERVEIPPASARILAWLAVQPGRRASRAAACARLWPDLDDRTARARLSQGLWRIRQCMPDGRDGDVALIESSESEVRLVDSVVTDVDELREFAAHRGSAGDAASVDWDRFGHGVLDEWDEPWIVEARTELHRLLDQALSREAELLVERHDHHGALTVAQTRTRLFPYDEAAWRSLLSLHDQMGDAAEASRAFARMAERLVEIGASPSPDLVAAQERRAAGSDPDPAGTGADRLIGRGQERAELIGLLEVTNEGFGATVIVDGESGIGKSRLLGQFVADARWRGLRVGRAQCSDVETPLQPLCRAIEMALAPIEVAALVDTLDKPWLRRAAALLPGLPWPPDVAERDADSSLMSPGEDDRQVQSLVEVVSSVARRHPVCLVVDDIHLADRWTLAAVHQLTELAGDLAVLLVVGYRTEAASRPPPLDLQRLDALPNSRRISLRGLNLRGTYELARQLDERITRSVADELMSASGGNPFLIRHLVDHAGSTVTDVAAAVRAGVVHDPIGDKLLARSPLENEVLQVLAIAEESLEVFSLTGVCSASSPETVAEAVLALVADGLVTERRGRYETAHDRVRTATLSSISAPSLQRIASELIRLRESGRTPAAAARLATRAGDWGRAVTAHRAAGKQAARLGAVSMAGEHYASAVEAGRLAGIEDGEMVDLLLDLHDVHVLGGDTDWQRESLGRLSRLKVRDRWDAVDLRVGWQALDDGDHEGALRAAERVIDASARPMSYRGSAHRLRAEARLAAGDNELCLRELRHTLDADVHSDDGDDPGLTAELLVTLANVQRECSDGDLGAAVLSRAIRVLERAELLDQLVDAQRQLGMSLIHSGETDGGFDSLHSALRLARRLGDQRRQANCHGSFGAANFVLLDRYGSGRPFLLEALRLATSTNSVAIMSQAANNLGFGESVLIGRSSSGIDYLEQAIEWAGDGRSPSHEAQALYTRAEVAFRIGDEETAAEMYAAAERSFVAIGSPQPLENVLADSALLRARIGDFAEASRFAARAGAVSRQNSHDETGALLEASLGEVCSLRGDAAGALAHAARIAPSFRPGVHERHHLLWRAARLFRSHSMDDDADIHLGLAHWHLRRCIDDFEPQLRGEVVGYQLPLIREATALAERCTVVVCEAAAGTPAGLRLDLTQRDVEVVQRLEAPAATIVAEIAAGAAERAIRPSIAHLSELFALPPAAIQEAFRSKAPRGFTFAR